MYELYTINLENVYACRKNYLICETHKHACAHSTIFSYFLPSIPKIRINKKL